MMMSSGAPPVSEQAPIKHWHLKKISNAVLLSDLLPKPVPSITLDVSCQEFPKLSINDGWTIAMIAFCGVVLILLIVSTIVDVIRTPDTSTGLLLRLLLAFSVYTNGSKLVNTNRQPNTLECIHGIRFLSMTWVLLGHTYAFVLPFTLNLLPTLTTIPAQFLLQIINNATVSVDSFFLLSGFLLSYLFLRRKGTKQQTKSPVFWLMYYVHRYLRLTPAYGVVIMLSYAFYGYFGDGPFHSIAEAISGVSLCKDNWWKNILYINNFWKQECIGWSWYLANDMQFYWISPLLLIPLVWLPKIGVLLLVALTIGSDIFRGVLIWQNNWAPAMMGSANMTAMAIANNAEQFNDLYVKPWTRANTYFIGVLFGYLYLKLTQGKNKFRFARNNSRHKLITLALWALFIGITWAVLWGPYKFAVTGRYTRLWATIYGSTFRSFWVIALAGIVFLCLTGNGEPNSKYSGFFCSCPINALLSWNMLFPLSRLTYCAYLVHPLVIYYMYGIERHPVWFSHYELVYRFFANLGITYLLALVVSLAFEAPAMQLEKIIFGSIGGEKRTKVAAEPVVVVTKKENQRQEK